MIHESPGNVVSNRRLPVVVSQGQVHLAGWAQRPEDVALAREIASEVRGVQRVDSFVRTWSSEDR